MVIESQKLSVQKGISLNRKGIFVIIKIKGKMDRQDQHIL